MQEIEKDFVKDILNSKGNWEKYWSLKFSFLAATILAESYVTTLSEEHGQSLKTVVIVNKKGYSSSYLNKTYRKEFGTILIKKYGSNVSLLLKDIKDRADKLSQICKKTPNKEIIKDFVKIFQEYVGAYHIIPRHFIDFLGEDKIEEVKDVLTEIRLYTEQIPIKAHDFLNLILKNIDNAHAEKLSFLTMRELLLFADKNTLPDFSILAEREKAVAFITKENTLPQITTDEPLINSLEEINMDSVSSDEIKGNSAYVGHAKGVVRVILDPKNYKVFNENDVLVTGMTRPDYVPLMKMASAIITDGGGLLSHAAIVAREFKKPCIIGTQFATKVLKDGDMVEVDAEKGIIRIIK